MKTMIMSSVENSIECPFEEPYHRDARPYNLAEVDLHFGGKYWLKYPVRDRREAEIACSALSWWLLVWLIFRPSEISMNFYGTTWCHNPENDGLLCILTVVTT
jgi:hypothetical protein